jgi:hypothetical protein
MFSGMRTSFCTLVALCCTLVYAAPPRVKGPNEPAPRPHRPWRTETLQNGFGVIYRLDGGVVEILFSGDVIGRDEVQRGRPIRRLLDEIEYAIDRIGERQVAGSIWGTGLGVSWDRLDSKYPGSFAVAYGKTVESAPGEIIPFVRSYTRFEIVSLRDMLDRMDNGTYTRRDLIYFLGQCRATHPLLREPSWPGRRVMTDQINAAHLNASCKLKTTSAWHWHDYFAELTVEYFGLSDRHSGDVEGLKLVEKVWTSDPNDIIRD